MIEEGYAQHMKLWRPWWWSLIGVIHESGKGAYRTTWGELVTRWSGPALSFTGGGRWMIYVSLGFVGAFIRLRGDNPSFDDPSWGWSWPFASSIHVSWGTRTKVINLPWDWGASVKYARLSNRGEWLPCGISEVPADALSLVEPFTYKLRSGETQARVATATVYRQEWRWAISRILGLPWPRKVRYGIWADFDDEVGEGAGSWKGGVLGCGEKIGPDESAWSALVRLTRERRFDR